MDDWTCLSCGEPIGMFDKVCRHCGDRQFGENDEYYPDAKAMAKAGLLLCLNNLFTGKQERKRNKKTEMFDDAEKLSLGLYPDDEGMKMSLITRILNKK